MFHFMDLPPELRVRFYELVLPGNTIHAGLSSDRFSTVCRAPLEDSAWAAYYLGRQPLPEGYDGICERHLGCVRVPFRGQEFAVLSVCRQIYNEADLIYIHNSIIVCDNLHNIYELSHALDKSHSVKPSSH